MRDGSNYYIADQNFAAWKVTSAGVRTRWATVAEPNGICAAADDNYYYTCTADGYVYRIDPTTGEFTEVCDLTHYTFGIPMDICAGLPVGVPGAVYVGALTVPTSYPTVWTVAPGYVAQVPLIG
jgi:hypothetical protein